MNNLFSDEKTKEHLNKIRSRSALCFGQDWKIVKALLNCLADRNMYWDYNCLHTKFAQALWPEDTKKLVTIFSGAKAGALTILMGKDWADKFIQIWNRLSEYPYPSGMFRRSFRTKSEERFYLRSGLAKLLSMIALVANDFSYQGYFEGSAFDFDDNFALPDLIALELDLGNDYVASRIRNRVYGDENGQMTRAMIKAMTGFRRLMLKLRPWRY